MCQPLDELGFWFDYSCPYAFLARERLDEIAERHGVRIVYRPMLLGGVFRARAVPQNLAGTLGPSKARHLGNDLARWCDVLGTSLAMPSGHPFRTVEALRATLATGLDPAVIRGFFRAYWQEGRPPSDRATLRDVVTAAGHDADAVIARLDDAVLKDDLRVRTEDAIARGIFGAPAWETPDGRIFWGQDRVDFALRAMGRVIPGVSPLETAARRTPRMPRSLDFYWDFSSPYAYLGNVQAEALAARTGAAITYRPMLLGAVFKAVGQDTIPMQTYSEAKRQYTLRDLHDWAAFLDVPFAFAPKFPVSSIKALRVYLALPAERQKAFRDAAFRAAWGEAKDISDDAVLKELIGDDAEAILTKTNDPEIKQALFAATDRAVAAGVFGAPAWVIDGTELFFGQDRIPLVERALMKS